MTAIRAQTILTMLDHMNKTTVLVYIYMIHSFFKLKIKDIGYQIAADRSNVVKTNRMISNQQKFEIMHKHLRDYVTSPKSVFKRR